MSNRCQNSIPYEGTYLRMYTIQPEGFVQLENSNKVCKIASNPYDGLRQTTRSWNLSSDK